jgi:hypothetical protein
MRTTRIFALLILSAFASNIVWAQNSKLQSSSRPLEVPSKSPTRVEGEVRFEAIQYPTKVSDGNGVSETTQVSATLNVTDTRTYTENKFDATFGKYVTAKGDQFIARELYTSYLSPSRNTQISLGRKVEFWSRLDQSWHLGLWQPQYETDPLRPETEGLSGLFFKQKIANRFEFIAYASSLYIPTTGPEVQERDGGLVSDGRWYRSPSSNFTLFGKSTRIAYALDIPEIEKLVNNPGWGMRLQSLNNDKGIWASLNYGYKPINDLVLQYKKNLFLPEDDPQAGEVTIVPAVAYHQLFGSDIGYTFENANISASVLQDLPDDKGTEAPFIIQNPRKMTAVALHTDFGFSNKFTTQPLKISLDYMRISGGNIQDFDANRVEQTPIFEQRFDLLHAASVKGDVLTSIGRKRMISSLKYTRELEQKGGIFNAELNYFPESKLGLILGADFLGVDDVSNENKDTRFLNQFRANDRYYGGLSYVF